MSNAVEIWKNFNSWVNFPQMKITDALEILILAFFTYHIILWIKTTKAWILLKGLVVIGLFMVFAWFFEMRVILWLAERAVNVGIIAILIVFQPELRKALEQLGNRNIISSLIPIDSSRNQEQLFSDKTLNELVRASFEMGKVKTGALIVIEKSVSLKEFERTGIDIDSLVSSQLLINIFEHNTPLHDGAVLIRGDRIVSATCYLPLSDNMELSKELGTRHRAAVGVSEVTDSLTIIVSEETGLVSVAKEGRIYRGVTQEELRSKLTEMQNKAQVDKKFKLWKGRAKHEADK